MRYTFWRAIVAALFCVIGYAPKAHAGDAECFAAHEKSQVLRLESNLMEAREVLKECSLAACPALVRSDCVQWLAEVQRAIPSVIFTAEADGEDVVDVKVTYDGKVLTETLDGRAIEFKPGAHSFKFEHGDFDPITRTVVLREGEKNRVVLIEFKSPEKAPVALPPGVRMVGPRGEYVQEPEGERPVPLLTWILGGAAVGAFIASGYFTFSALGDKSDLEKPDGCSPYCTDSEVDPIRKKASLATYTSLGGTALAIGATIFYLARPTVYEDDNPEVDKGTDDKKKGSEKKAALPRVDFMAGSDQVFFDLRGEF